MEFGGSKRHPCSIAGCRARAEWIDRSEQPDGRHKRLCSVHFTALEFNDPEAANRYSLIDRKLAQRFAHEK